jgi:hypothetical protein
LTLEEIMKLILTAFTATNLLIGGLAVITLGAKSSYDQDGSFHNGLARIAVRERLDSLPGVDANIRLAKGCVERSDDGGVVVGSGDAMSRFRIVEGVPVTDHSRFSYRANVSSNCGGYNLNCYKVDTLEVDGSRTVSPRL